MGGPLTSTYYRGSSFSNDPHAHPLTTRTMTLAWTRTFTVLALLCATGALGAALPGDSALAARGKVKSGLNRAAHAAGKLYFGTATNSDQWNDTTYFDILKQNSEFGQITAANVMKWVSRAPQALVRSPRPSLNRSQFATEPSPGNFTFADADIIANFARDTGKKLRGHNCVWHNQLPEWVENGTFTPAELAFVVERHCATLVGHYRGQV